MVRTLTAILENGETIEESDETKTKIDGTNEVMDTKETSQSVEGEPPTALGEARAYRENVNRREVHDDNHPQPSTSAPDRTSDPCTGPQGGGNPHEGLLRMGIATLSFVVGGVLLSQTGPRNQQEERNDGQSHGSTDGNEATGNGRSTVEIIEIEEETEEEWVSVPQ